MDCSPPGSSICGIFQARILGGLPCPSPGNLPDPEIQPGSPALQADSLLSEPPGKLQLYHYGNQPKSNFDPVQTITHTTVDLFKIMNLITKTFQ